MGGNCLDQHPERFAQEAPFQIDGCAIEYYHQQDIHQRRQAQYAGDMTDHRCRQHRQQDLGHIVENRLGRGIIGCPVGEEGRRSRDGNQKQPEQQQFSPEIQQRQAGTHHPGTVHCHNSHQLPAPETELGQTRHHSHCHQGDEIGPEQQEHHMIHLAFSFSQ